MLTILLLSGPGRPKAQIFAWVGQFNGGQTTKILNSQSFDNDGNIYTTGIFEGTVDFDPGSGVLNLTSVGTGDIFLTKMGPSGNLVWAKQIGASGIDVGISVCFDTRGFINASGTFRGTVDFDTGPGTTNLTSSGAADGYVARFDLNGNLVWARQVGGIGDEVGPAIMTDSRNNIICSIYYASNSYDCDPGPGVFIIPFAGGIDMALFKLDKDGIFLWAKNWGGPYNDVCGDPKLDKNDNIYLAGFFFGTVDFDPGPGTYNLSTPDILDMDGVYMKFDSSGNFKWARQISNTNPSSMSKSRGLDLAIDDAGNVYGTGTFQSSADLDTGPGILNVTSAGGDDAFVVKMDRNGNFIWGKKIGSTGEDRSIAMHFNSDGQVQIVGYFDNTVDFDPGSGTFNMSSAGLSDNFFLYLSANGEFIKASRVGGAGYDYVSVMINKNDITVLGGVYNGTTDFDPGPGVANLTSTATGNNSDMFVAKYSASNKVTGVTYKDQNADGIRQAGEPPLAHVVIKGSTGGATYYAISDSNGYYSLETDLGSYVIEPNRPLYYTSILPPTHTANFPVAGLTDTANHFGLFPSSVIKDLRLYINYVGVERPAAVGVFRVTITNTGTDPVSGNVVLVHDNNFQYVSATPAPVSYVQPAITWNFSNLMPSMSQTMDGKFGLLSTVTLGTILKTYATVNPVAGDFEPANNSDTVFQTVVSSLDPNDKKVKPAGPVTTSFISAGNYMEYTIRFQNTGNDTAFLVVIKDTLSTNLEMSSFEMLSASHKYAVTLKGSNIAEWTFSNILLPDSTRNEPASHGFVRYRIKPKNGLGAGNQIKNKAAIYFDYNSPVITNEVINIITVITANPDPGMDQVDVKLFPNPSGTVLYLGVKGKFGYTVYDETGKNILRSEYNLDQTTIQVDSWPKGAYLIEINSGKKRVTRKVLIQ